MSECFSLHTRGVVSRRRSTPLAVAAGIASLVSASAALAADADTTADAGTEVSGVTVAAAKPNVPENSLSRLPARLQDIPQSITVLNRTLLQSQGATSLADALRNVPGITVGGAEGGQIGNNINLNGFTARTDIFLDGFRDRGQYYRDTFALDSVEVLMGPSSMLFGRGSTGGAINQVSKRPKRTPATEVDVSGTTNGLVRGTADWNAPISDTSALRVAVMGQGGPTSTRRKTTVNDYGVAPSFTMGMGTPTELTISALVQHNNDRPDYGVPPLNGRPAQTGFNTIYGHSDDRTIQDIAAVSGEIKHRFSDSLILRDQVQFNGVTTDARETAPQGIGTVDAKGYTAATPAGISNLPLSQLFARLQSHDRVIHDTSIYNQLELKADFATGPFGNSLIVGAEIGRDEYRNQNYTRTSSCNGVALPAGYTACVPVLSPTYASSPTLTEVATNLAAGADTTAAVYFNDTLSVTSQLKLVGGLRYDHFSATITNSINSANTPGNAAFPRLSQTVGYTSARAGVIWQPTEPQSYYFSYSTSFNPSLEQLTSTTGISQPLPPETNEAYEVGGKWETDNDRFGVTAAVFQITKLNSRSQNPDNTFTANGNIRVRGVRLGASGRVADHWLIYGGYTYLDARIIKAIAPGTLGMIPVNTAKHNATLWTTYDFLRHWQIGGGVTYLSQRFLNNTDLVSVPGYVRLDATLAYHQPHYEVRINVFNLAGAHYYDSLIQSDGGRAVLGSGPTGMLTLIWKP